jgi:hypothetical protein
MVKVAVAISLRQESNARGKWKKPKTKIKRLISLGVFKEKAIE